MTESMGISVTTQCFDCLQLDDVCDNCLELREARDSAIAHEMVDEGNLQYKRQFPTCRTNKMASLLLLCDTFL